MNVSDEATLFAVRASYLGTELRRSLLSTNASKGWRASWVTGSGLISIADGIGRDYPSTYPLPDADGWYEFGLKEGYGEGFNSEKELHYIDGEHISWPTYAFPEGAKLRLVGGVLLDTVPDAFSEIDQSQVKLLYLASPVAFANGTSLKIPSGAIFRYLPAGTWVQEGNRHWYKTAGSGALTSDIEMNGVTIPCMSVS